MISTPRSRTLAFTFTLLFALHAATAASSDIQWTVTESVAGDEAIYCAERLDSSNPSSPVVFGGVFKSLGGRDASRLALYSREHGVQHIGGGISSAAKPRSPAVVSILSAKGHFGARDSLVVAGDFTIAGKTAVSGIAAWTGGGWNTMQGGVSGVDRAQLSRVIDGSDFMGDGRTVPRLFVTGRFKQVGEIEANGIAEWREDRWHALPGLHCRSGRALCTWSPSPEETRKSRLVVAGDLYLPGMGQCLVAMWDGESWSSLESFEDVRGDTVRDLLAVGWACDQGGQRLFAVGPYFRSPDDALRMIVTSCRVSEWDRQLVLRQPRAALPWCAAAVSDKLQDAQVGQIVLLAGKGDTKSSDAPLIWLCDSDPKPIRFGSDFISGHVLSMLANSDGSVWLTGHMYLNNVYKPAIRISPLADDRSGK